MFVQFIDAPVADVPTFRRQLEHWHERIAPQASGWLGTTAGVTDEGTGFIAARFATAEDARENSERPDQAAWWEETERLLGGPATFQDVDEVIELRAGGSDDAGFVQVIRGRVHDITAARSLLEEDPGDERPDVLGGLLGLSSDGSYTMVVYFTSEADARAGEARAVQDGDAFARELDALHVTPPQFMDLRDPGLWSA